MPLKPITFIRKANKNKRTGQLSVTLPKKKMPSGLKFGEDLFVEITFAKTKKRVR